MFTSDPISPFDVLVLFKEHVSSAILTQAPMLFLPFSRLLLLDPSTLNVLARNRLSDKATKEFRKSASHMADFPWCLKAAGDWLERWVGASWC